MLARSSRLVAVIILALGGTALLGATPANAAHTVTSVAPSSSPQGRNAVPFTVSGTGFSNTAGTPTVAVSGTGVTVTSVSFVDANTLTGTLAVDPAAAPGARDVTVTQLTLDSSSCTGCFTVVARPVPTSIAPSTASNNGSSPTNVTVTGTGFKPGAQLTLVSGPYTIDAVEGTITATSIPATVDLRGQPPGLSYDVRVVNPDSGAGTQPGAFSLAGGAPTLTAVSGPIGRGATNRVLHLTGTNLARGATVSFNPTTGIVGGTPVWQSLTQIDIPVSVSGAAATGLHSVTVTNTDTQAATCGDCLAVTAAPSITSVSPNALGQGAAPVSVDVKGTGFSPGNATLSVAGTGVTVTNVSATATDITANVSVDRSAAPGTRAITVVNPDGGTASSPDVATSLTINQGPTLTTVSPSALGQGATNQVVTLTGTGFASGVAADFGPGVTMHSPVSLDSPTQITAHVDVAPGAAPGLRTVTVTNTDGGSAASVGGFTVGNGPVISSLSPTALGRNAAHQAVVVQGAGFTASTLVTFGPAGIVVNTAHLDSPSQLTLDVSVAPTATLGTHDVTVKNADAGTSTAPAAFTVDDAPSVTSVAPTSVGQGAAATLTLTGTGFTGTPTVSLGAGITTGTVQVVSPTSLTVAVTVAPGATTGAHDVTVTNPDHGVSPACAGCLSVTAAPVVSAITPASGAVGGPVNISNLAGSGFQTGVAVALERAGYSDVPMTGITQTPTKITGTFDLTSAPPGAWTVRVTNPDSGVGRLAGGFTVTGNTPAITNLTPASLVQGQSQTVTVNGTDFAPGAVITVSGSGVTVGTATVSHSGTQASAPFTIAGNAAAGARNVTVTNTDNQVTTCAGCFTVVASPVVTSLTPSSVPQGATSQTVVITGDHFAGTPAVSFDGGSVSVDSVTRDSATQLTIKVSVDPAAATTARGLTVTNPDSGAGALPAALTITAGPKVTALDVSSLGQGATNHPVGVTGTGFGPTPSVSFTGSGITVTSVTRDSATHLSLTVSVTPTAPTGLSDIAVTNPDGGRGSTPGLLTITVHPGVSGVSPSALGQGTTHRALVVSGTAFQSGATVTLSGTGVTVETASVDSDHQVTVTVSVDPAAAAGARDMTVTNPDGGTVTAPTVLTINAAPTLASLTPSAIAQGKSHQGLVLTGTAFQATPGVAISGTGVTVESVTRTSDTALALVVSVADVAGPGLRAVTVTNPDGGAVTAPAAFTVATAAGAFTGLTPARLLDTRLTGPAGGLCGGLTRELNVTGVGGVPDSGVGSVAVNVTATNPTRSSFLTVFPKGVQRPTSSNLNFVAKDTIANMVIAKVGPGGAIELYNSQGCVQVIVDVVGWYSDDSGSPSPGGFDGLTPARLLDTRTSGQGPCVSGGEMRELKVTGVGGVPLTGAGAVAINVTVNQPTAASFLTVYPKGVSRPLASSLNFVPGQTVPNLVIAKTSPDGSIELFNASGCVHVIVDVVGWFADGAGASSPGVFNGLTPSRLLDTRGADQGPCVDGGSSRELKVTGVGGVPASGVGAVALNVTVTRPTVASFLTVYPNGVNRPGASSLNFGPGQTIANLVLAKVSPEGFIEVYNSAGCAHVIADVVGYFNS